MLPSIILVLLFAVIQIRNGYTMEKLSEILSTDTDPFTINLGKQKTVTVNLDKLLLPNIKKADSDKHLGELRVGILHEEIKCVEILGDEPVPYLRDDGLYNRVPITYDITHDQFYTLLNDNPLVIITFRTIEKSERLSVCGGQLFSEGTKESVHVLATENLYVTDIPMSGALDQRCSSNFLAGQNISYFTNVGVDPLLRRFGLPASATADLVPEGGKFIKPNPKRPLLGYASDHLLQALLTEKPECSLPFLKTQLQTAIELEWSLLPLYLTAQFSIKSQNTGAHERIHDISVQKMLHFVQAANLLIAVGGVPVINSSTAPKYPHTKKGLPGDVLKYLPIPLTKLTLHRVYNTFMQVETPTNSSAVYPPLIRNVYTIGAFYNETLSCIEQLGDKIYNSVVNQVPGTDFDEKYGELYYVYNVETAKQAIEQIVTQGAGKSPINPYQLNSKEYAHFYKFEEIVCQEELVRMESTGHYAYEGNVIPYSQEGVYNMIDNPSKSNIKPGTDCYMEAKAFHEVYVTMIHRLEHAFTFNSDSIGEAIMDMDTLASRANETFKVPVAPGSKYTCGPVWDMDFE